MNEPFQTVGFAKVDEKQYRSPNNRIKTVRGIGTGYDNPIKNN